MLSKLKLLVDNLNQDPQLDIDVLPIPAVVLGAVVWRAGATAEDIDERDGKLKYYRKACELVALTDCMDAALGKGDHFLDLPYRVRKHQELGTRWYRDFESKLRDQRRLVDGSFNWSNALEMGRVYKIWCTEFGGGCGILLFLMMAHSSEDFPYSEDAWDLCGGYVFFYQVYWIAEYIKQYMPKFIKLIAFMDPWAKDIYRVGWLSRAQRGAFCIDVGKLEVEWTILDEDSDG